MTPHPLIAELQRQYTGGWCGCFYCLETYAGLEISEWTDEGTTPICPRCGIDSVLCEARGDDLSPGALAARRERSFGDA